MKNVTSETAARAMYEALRNSAREKIVFSMVIDPYYEREAYVQNFGKTPEMIDEEMFAMFGMLSAKEMKELRVLVGTSLAEAQNNDEANSLNRFNRVNINTIISTAMERFLSKSTQESVEQQSK